MCMSWADPRLPRYPLQDSWHSAVRDHKRSQSHRVKIPGYKYTVTNHCNKPLNLPTLKYFCINHENKGCCPIWNRHKCLSQLFPFHLNTYYMLSGHGSTTVRNILILLVRGPSLSSESDVYRRQILTYKDDPRAVRVKANLSNLNVHALEVVSRCREPQLQVGENYSYLFTFKWV